MRSVARMTPRSSMLVPVLFVAACVQHITGGEAAAQWTETILVDSQPASTSRGFDGAWRAFDDAGLEIVCSGAEQATSDNVVVHALDGSYSRIWGSNSGSEDVVCGYDFNGDGIKDVASASESQERIRIWFGPYVDTTPADGVNDTAPITLTYTPSMGDIAQAWIKLDVTDVDCDGDWDLVAGGKKINTHRAAWGWWEWTTGTSFTFHEIGEVGWTMAIQAIDWDGDSPCKDDIFITDRIGANQVASQKGAWLWSSTNSGAPLDGTFSGVQLDQGSGEVQYGAARDLNFDDCMDFIFGNRTTIWIATNDCDATYTVTAITFPSNVGDFHAPILCPDTTVDGPFVMTFALSTGTQSGVILYEKISGTWVRTEISGASGDVGVTRKWDNGFCGWTSGGKHYFLTTEGGDSTQADDKGIVKFQEP
jgi:hypothetical protein